MASVLERGKLYTLFTLLADDQPFAVKLSPPVGGSFRMVGGIAIAMFVALVGFGGKYFGWQDPDGKVQLALVTAFILGIIGGFKSRG
ncbi:MAG: hypothetical protein ACJ8ET_12675 [Sphingomicrobium sp.]